MNRYRIRLAADRLARLSAASRLDLWRKFQKTEKFQKFSFHINFGLAYEKAFKENKISIV